MKTKVKIIIAVLVVLLICGGIGVYMYSNRFIYNKEGDTGNTTGNLYNDGMFCVYDGFVYFANPNDNGKLYRMKEDGSGCEKVSDDSVSHINICNGYIYYVRDNMAGNISFVSIDLKNGISRLKIGEEKADVIKTGVANSLLLCGNDLYYQSYNKNTGRYYMRKSGIDGKTDAKLFDESYRMLSYSDGKIYFINTETDHNMMYYRIEDESVSTFLAGNFHMPDCEGDYIYYIDLENGHRLTRLNIKTSKTEVLNEDYVVTYNVNLATGEIYYQTESANDDHRLCKMNLDGSENQTVIEGNYTDINFTKEYVYFYELKGKEMIQLYRAKLSGGEPESFDVPVDQDT